MVVEYIRYRVPVEHRADFEAAYGRAGAVLARSPQCQEYELARSVDEPECYILRIIWTSADDHLTGFRTGGLFASFFAEIKPYVDDIEEMRHYDPTDVAGPGAAVPTLYDWAGGASALERLTTTFYDLVSRDDLVGPLFADMDRDHPHYVAMWLGEVFGGPDAYTRERGGYAHMLSQHLGRNLSEPQRRRWISLLLDAADLVDLPADPEFRAALVGYLEWGTRLAVANSKPDAEPVQQAPVPRWGWGVAPPYRG